MRISQTTKRLPVISLIILAAALVGCSSLDQVLDQPPAAIQPATQPDDRAARLVDQARDRYDNGNFVSSRETITEALKLSPDNAAARIVSARLYLQADELDAAARDLAVACQSDPTCAEAEYLAGIVCRRLRQPVPALEHYQRASELASAELTYTLATAHQLAAMGRQPQAIAFLQDKLSSYPHSSIIRDALGLLLTEQAHYDTAADILASASALSPADAAIQQHWATSLYLAKKYYDCEKILVPLVEDESNEDRADLLITLAECQSQNAQLLEARITFARAAQIAPGNPQSWRGLAQTGLTLDDLPAADAALSRAIVLDPVDSQTNLLLGYLRLRQSRDREALAAFQQASQSNPSDPVILCMAGYVQQKLGRSDQAIICYSQALKLNPKDEMATALMARLDLHE